MLEPVLLSLLLPFLSLSLFLFLFNILILSKATRAKRIQLSAMAVVSSSSSSSTSMWVFFFFLLPLFIHLQATMATTTPQISHLRSQHKQTLCFSVRSFFSMCSVLGWFSFSYIVWISKLKQCFLSLSHPQKKLRVIGLQLVYMHSLGSIFKQCAISDVKTIEVGFTTVIQLLTTNQRKLNTLRLVWFLKRKISILLFKLNTRFL